MKTLILVRHAKSSWSRPELEDVERPLNKRGKRNAPEMGRRLAGRGLQPDLLVTSPAARARATAEAMAEEIGYPVASIEEEPFLYGADADELLQWIQEQDDELDQVMIFGHNPCITDLVNQLSHESVDNVPTCGVACFRIPVASWAEVGQGESVPLDFDYPKKTA